jgi:hypothetical protein
MQGKAKQIAMGLAIAGLAILIYNKVPAVKKALGGM